MRVCKGHWAHQSWWLSCRRLWQGCTSLCQKKLPLRHTVPTGFEGICQHSSLTRSFIPPHPLARSIIPPHPLARRCRLSCLHACHGRFYQEQLYHWECSDHCFADLWKCDSFSKGWDREKKQTIRDGVMTSYSCVCRMCLVIWHLNTVVTRVVRCSPAGITLALHRSSTTVNKWQLLNTRCAGLFAQRFHDLLSF